MYNIREDPDKSVNLVAQHTEKVKQLHSMCVQNSFLQKSVRKRGHIRYTVPTLIKPFREGQRTIKSDRLESEN